MKKLKSLTNFVVLGKEQMKTVLGGGEDQSFCGGVDDSCTLFVEETTCCAGLTCVPRIQPGLAWCQER